MVVFALVEEADNGERDEDAEADREESIESTSSPFRSWSSRNVVTPFPVATSGYRSRFVYLSPLFRLFVTRHYFISPLFSSKRRCILSNER